MSILELGSLQLTLFAMMLTGALLKKKGVIDENGKKCLSDLCISLSTVFMKQHSILDVLCALPVCALGWWLCYGRPGRHG